MDPCQPDLAEDQETVSKVDRKVKNLQNDGKSTIQ